MIMFLYFNNDIYAIYVLYFIPYVHHASRPFSFQETEIFLDIPTGNIVPGVWTYIIYMNIVYHIYFSILYFKSNIQMKIKYDIGTKEKLHC